MEWSINPLIAIGIGLAVMFFGYFFGLFEGRGQGYKNRKKEEAEEKKHQPVRESLPPASPPVPSDETSILDVSIDKVGQLCLRLDGTPTDASSLDSEQRRRLIEILTQMRPWLEAPKVPPAPARPQPAPVSGTMPTPPPNPAPVSTSTPVSKPTPASEAAPSEDDDTDDDHPGPQSIVAQIDAILQARLARSPLADKGIRLQESLDGGVIVWVGIQKFEGVDDVPDESIKTALKSAIAEWEKKYTPGF